MSKTKLKELEEKLRASEVREKDLQQQLRLARRGVPEVESLYRETLGALIQLKETIRRMEGENTVERPASLMIGQDLEVMKDLASLLHYPAIEDVAAFKALRAKGGYAVDEDHLKALCVRLRTKFDILKKRMRELEAENSALREKLRTPNLARQHRFKPPDVKGV